MHDQRHPHLLPLYASFVSFNHLWMVMPFIEGGSALDVLQASFREVCPSPGPRRVLLGLTTCLALYTSGQCKPNLQACSSLSSCHGACSAWPGSH